MPLSRQALFHIAPFVNLDEVQNTLDLSLMAAQSLFGPGRVALEAHCVLRDRILLVDTTTELGCALALLLWGFLEKEFGTDSIRMHRPSEGVLG